jgi:replication factor C large subunit
MTAKYDLEAEHVSFVTGSGKDTNKVQNIVEEAEKLREEEAVEHSGGAFEGSHGSRAAESVSDSTESDSTESDADEASSDDDSEAEASGDDDSQAGLGDFA